MFEKLNLSFNKSKFDKEKDVSRVQNSEFSLPLVNAKDGDNGIMYYGRPEDFDSETMTIDIVNDGAVSTGNVYSQPQKTGVLYNAYLIKSKFGISEPMLHFFAVTIQKSIKMKFSYELKASWERVKEEQIQLPLKEKSLDFSNPCDNLKNIDFDFMESFIRELEEERIRELNAYLLATGLKDYTLTPEEENALEAFKTVQWEEFELPEIFDIKNTHNILSSEIVAESGTTPYLCASAENNGVSSYISYKNELLENGNCIFIGGKTFVVSYQKDDFYSNDSHNLALYLKEQNVTKSNQLYLATCIRKGLSHKYSWGDSISGSKIKSDKFQLPTKNNKPDYATMETFIKAVEKLVIKDVVLYADSKIKATKNVVKKDFEYKINEDAGLLNVADSIN